MGIAPLRGKRVLVVEDETLIAMMAEEMIMDLGASVIGPARSVDEALKLAESADIDLALLDVNLNGARVDPVLARLKERGVPVVLATGYGTTALDVPQDVPIIRKPYTEERLGFILAATAEASHT
jgi:CheY-like chemotaxis protein